jgi:FSR family fosmidomycin resistance protein-like MFS transporter
MFAHICVDINQGALPAMLPFFTQYYGLNYAQATTLVLCSSIISSVIQPLFGWIGDKTERPWFMSVGVFLAGSGLTLMAFMNNFYILMACAALTGVGVAMFHPEGGRLANVVAGASKGTGMANFGVGGNLGFSAGALLVTASFTVFGEYGAAVFIFPAVIMAIILLTQTKRFEQFTKDEALRVKTSGEPVGTNDWSQFVRATIVNILRAVVFQGFTVFIPLYWVDVFNQPANVASGVLTVVTLIGAAGNFVGGRLADRVGFKKLVLIFASLMTASVFVFLFMHNIILAGIFVTGGMLCLNFCYSPIITLSQSSLPSHVSLASGISLGVSVSLGGLAAPALGTIGDNYGLNVVFAVICAICLLMFLAALFLKNDRKKSPTA